MAEPLHQPRPLSADALLAALNRALLKERNHTRDLEEATSDSEQQTTNSSLQPSEPKTSSKHISVDLEHVTRQIVDAKIEAAEARIDVKLANLLAEMQATSAKLDRLAASTANLRSTVVMTGLAGGLAIVGIIAAMLAYGAWVFGAGVDASNIASEAARRAVEQAFPPQLLGTINTKPTPGSP